MEENDRLALLLHCLEGRPFREVGEALGTGEDAARKRVNRALDRLTEFFRQHGFAVPSITTGAALFTGATAPATLVGSVVAAGIAAIPAATTLGMLMTSTTIKASLATVLVAAVALPITLQQTTIRRQAAELGSLRDASAELDRVRLKNASLAASQVNPNELARLRDGYRELMRLRAEVARLRNEAAANVTVDEKTTTRDQAEEVRTATVVPGLFRAELHATMPLGATLVTGGWTTAPGRRSLVLLTPSLMGEGDEDRQVLITSTFAEVPEAELLDMGLALQRQFAQSAGR
jgi:hypothetical protein